MSPPPHLGVSVEKSIHLQLLDEVKVWMGGDMRPSQVRLPELRFILSDVTSSTTVSRCAIGDQSMLDGVTQELVDKDVMTAAPPPTSTSYNSDDVTSSHISLYSVLHEAEESPLNFPSLSSTKIRRKKKAPKKVENVFKCNDIKREEITRGRCSYGGVRSAMSTHDKCSYL